MFSKMDFRDSTIICHGILEDSEIDRIREFLDRNRRAILQAGRLLIDFSDSTGIDSVPAVVIQSFCQELKRAGVRVVRKGASEAVEDLFSRLAKFQSTPPPLKQPISFRQIITSMGENFFEFSQMIKSLVRFLIDTMGTFMEIVLHPLRIRWQMVMYYMEESGYKAIPIVAVLNWLLGVVLGYQAGYQMRVFGAETFMPALLGYSITWEIGPMLAAVLVAGRSGSAYAAEIGTMQVREEVDALRVMGFDTFSYLVTPKMIALLLVMPFLVLLANISGLFGGLLAGSLFLGLPADTFISELGKALIPLDIIWGMLKSVVYAIIIATVGSFMGMRVKGGASAVGQATTAAVVLSIFSVILADALLSLLFVHIRPGLSL